MIEIGDGIFVETELDGVNVAAVRTSKGIVCIDAPSYPRDAREWVYRLERMLALPVYLLLLTDFNGDRILNTRWFHAPVLTQKLTADRIFGYEKRYPQNLISSLQERNPKAGRELTHSPVHKPSMSYTNSLSIFLDPYTFELNHQPGPTPANTWIKILEEDILFVGDSLVAGTLPVYSEFRWQSWLDSLRQLASEHSSYKVIVPGRGEIDNSDTVNAMIDYLENIEQTIMIRSKQGYSPIPYQELALDIMGDYPTNSYPREWLVGELTLCLKRIHDQLVIQSGSEVDRAADEMSE
jgi:glyoxylase-like metal-dependent hydrolase (beta-lactamase superfamily II)